MPQNKFSGSVDEILENLKKEEIGRPASDRAVEDILADLGLESGLPRASAGVKAEDISAIISQTMPKNEIKQETVPPAAKQQPRKPEQPAQKTVQAQKPVQPVVKTAQPAKPELPEKQRTARPAANTEPLKAPSYPIKPQRTAPAKEEEEPAFAPPKLGATMQLDSDFQRFFSESVAVIPEEQQEQHPGFFARFLQKKKPADKEYFEEEEDYLDNPDPTNLVEEGTLMIPGQEPQAGTEGTLELEIPLQPEKHPVPRAEDLDETQEIDARMMLEEEKKEPPVSTKKNVFSQNLAKSLQKDLDATREIQVLPKEKNSSAVNNEPTQVIDWNHSKGQKTVQEQVTGSIRLDEPTGTIDFAGAPAGLFESEQEKTGSISFAGSAVDTASQELQQDDFDGEETEKTSLADRFHLPKLFGSEEEINTENTEPFAEEEAASYIEDYEDPEDAEEVEAELGKMHSGFGLRACVSGVIALLMLYMGASAGSSNLPAIPVADPAISPAAFLAVQLVLLCIVCAMNWRVFAKGIPGIWKEPTQDSIPAVAAAGAAIQLLFALLNAENYDPSAVTMFAGPAVILLSFNALGRWLMSGVNLRNFQMAAAGNEHTAASIVKDRELTNRLAKDMGEPEPCLLANRKTGLVKGFLKHSFSLRASDAIAQKCCWILLGGAVVSAIVCAFAENSGELSLAAFAGTLCLGAPLAATLISAVPSMLMQKSASRVGAVVPGWSAISQLGRANMVVAGAKDLFPAACVRLHGIKTFEKQRIDLAILYAASVLIKGCDTLRDVFMEIIQDRTDILYEVENLENDPGYGFTAWVDNNRVIVGNRAMMDKQGVEIPSLDYENRYTKGRREPVYLAVSGRAYAMFIVSYRANAQVAQTLESLRARGISVLVSSDDFCLNSKLAAQVYGLPADCIKVLSQAERRLLDPLETYQEKTEGCMTHMGTFASFVGGLTAAAGAAVGERNASFVQTAGVIFSCLLALLLAFTGGIAQLSVLAVLLYGAAWGVLALAMPMLRSY